MKNLLGKIQSGEFAKQWIGENEAGRQQFLEMRREHAGTQIEEVGKTLRAMMPFLKKGRPTAQQA
jgi:ketol-acid reductoisomerase